MKIISIIHTFVLSNVVVSTTSSYFVPIRSANAFNLVSQRLLSTHHLSAKHPKKSSDDNVTKQKGRKIRYSVAQSLDGFIATSDGGYDWIVEDFSIDMEYYISKIDTLIMGRGTYQTTVQTDYGKDLLGNMEVHVISKMLQQQDILPNVHVIDGTESEINRIISELKKEQGKQDIWLFGGGMLAGSLLQAGLVDRVEVAIMPVLLGNGIPLVMPPLGTKNDSQGSAVVKLNLHSAETFYDSGIMLLKYDVEKL